MSAANLTAKYRPRTFADVAGQDAVKTILSRAAALDRIAPAYLFSGTRGVGKTTIARIFAKALNCETAPTAEPCNECRSCRQATAGVAVDIIEIDAASHGKVEDARRLKEDIGYAPLESRYKVFIIDEAHMLTTQAFNALLKTLEEPPPRVTFILATTEPHKFPATIISRCQHYSFKMLPQADLAAHLEKILRLEGVEYDPGAVQIIARRGAGSVRDSMSLLGQALAFCVDGLREAEVRSFLGLAGQDVFFALMEALHARDLVAVSTTLRQVLDKGLDLGFFLRELGGCWRNMFLLRQAGEGAKPLLGLAGEEADAWLAWAKRFSPAHIHACWQMTLEGQRRVLTSLEPALALELLLLNLASLPDLVSLETLAPVQGGGTSCPGGAVRGGGAGAAGTAPAGTPRPAPASRPHQAAPAKSTAGDLGPASMPPSEAGPSFKCEPERPAPTVAPDAARSWPGFVEFVLQKNGQAESTIPGIRQLKGRVEGGEMVILCDTGYLAGRIQAKECMQALERFAKEYFGGPVSLRVECAAGETAKTQDQLWEEAVAAPGVQRVMEAFQAKVMSVERRRPNH